MPLSYHYEPSNLVVGLLAKCASCCNCNVLPHITSEFRPQHTEDDTTFVEAVTGTPNLKAFRFVSCYERASLFGD
jgi:hypothetical protein